MKYTDLIHGRDGLIQAKALLYLSKICGSPVTYGTVEAHSFTAPVTPQQFTYASSMLFRAEGRPTIKHRPGAFQYVWKISENGRLIFEYDINARYPNTIKIFVRT